MQFSYLNRLRALREEKGLTQLKTAEVLGISPRTYCDYENGKLSIPVRTLVRLAAYYDVSVDYIAAVSNIRSVFPRL